MTKIKICGITNEEDAKEAARLGADFVGFIFYKKSPRYVEPKEAKAIVDELPSAVIKVGVFVDERADVVLETARFVGLDAAQLHGDESPEYCSLFKGRLRVIKAFRIKDKKGLRNVNSYDAPFYLLDTCREGKIGGTGKVFDWSILSAFEFSKPVILAGGLRCENLLGAIRKVAPYAVDVSSGVEDAPRKKDFELMRKFIETARKADLNYATR